MQFTLPVTASRLYSRNVSLFDPQVFTNLESRLFRPDYTQRPSYWHPTMTTRRLESLLDISAVYAAKMKSPA